MTTEFNPAYFDAPGKTNVVIRHKFVVRLGRSGRYQINWSPPMVVEMAIQYHKGKMVGLTPSEDFAEFCGHGYEGDNIYAAEDYFMEILEDRDVTLRLA